jgi:hypothetical protein
MIAQQNAVPTEKEQIAAQKIYFASGSSELDNTALQNLKTLLAYYKDSLQAEIRLQAFTDDIGSKKNNEALALKRKKIVQNYLIEQGVPIAIIETQASKQLELDPNQDANQQRKEYRRVNVELWLATEEPIVTDAALNNFFAQNREKAKQYFSFQGNEGAFLEGAKGTVLQIPPNSFVNQNNEVVEGLINFALIESYSYNDMLTQNLSTKSGGELLETGGMVYLEAKDSNSNELALKKGSIISTSMASEEALLTGMEGFNGVQDSVGNIEWVPTGQPATSIANNLLLPEDFRKNSVYEVTKAEVAFAKMEEVPVWKHKVQRLISRPSFNKKLPKIPKYKVLKAPNREALASSMVQKKQEDNSSFNTRVRSKYSVLQKKYRRESNVNKLKRMGFKRDSLSYERSLARYDKAMGKYLLNNQDMRLCLGELYENTVDFKIKEYETSYRTIHAFFNNVNRNNIKMTAAVSSLVYSTESYLKEGYEMADLLDKLTSSAFQGMNEKDCNLLGKTLGNNPPKFKTKVFYKYSKLNDERLQKRLDKHSYQLAKLYHRTSNDAEISQQDLKKIRTWNKRIKKYYNFRWLTRIDEKGKRLYGNKTDLIQEFVRTEKEVKRLQGLFLERKNELGLIQLERIAEVSNQIEGRATSRADVAYSNRSNAFYANKELATLRGMSLPIVSLGWSNLDKVPPAPRMLAQVGRRIIDGVVLAPLVIVKGAVELVNAGVRLVENIDSAVKEARFNNIQKRTVELTVDTEEKNNTAIFIVFKNQKTVIRAYANTSGGYDAGRQFKNDQVKIIGLRIQGKDSELFIEEGPVAKLNGIKPTFQKKSMDEIEAVLASM